MSIEEPTVAISEEALRRQNVEAAFKRGAPIVFRAREGTAALRFGWRDCPNPLWLWEDYDYRVKGTDATPRRTKAQLLDQIHELLVELRDCDA